MTFDERLRAICTGMAARGLDLIAAVHDGAHFIETPNEIAWTREATRIAERNYCLVQAGRALSRNRSDIHLSDVGLPLRAGSIE